MAEVLSAIEIGLAITGIINNLFTYARSVKHAKNDIHTLAQELFALKAALDHFDLHSRADLPPELASQATDVLTLTSETLQGVTSRLERANTSRLRSAVEAAKWPFQAGEVKKHIESIERAKSWFVMVILRDSTDATQRVVEELRGLVQLVERDIMDRKESELVRETSMMLSWLAPFDSRAQLEKATRGKTPGTGQWVLGKEFQAWLNVDEVDRPFLWISGMSGSGKTVLFSTIVDEISSMCAQDPYSSCLIGYHCCSLDEAASQQLPNILGSILAHVGAVQPALLEKIAQRQRASPRLVPQNDLTIQELKSVFDHVAASTRRFYILVDAVNEAPAVKDALVEFLETMCRDYAGVRVLVTCTGEAGKKSGLIHYRPMNTLSVNSDIVLYARRRLETERGLANLSPKIREQILNRIITYAQGMFRWAKLCLDRLSALRTGRDIRDALADMPPTLNETYCSILNRIAPHDRPLARETLLWLCFSVRPLRLTELAEAVILRDGDTSIEEDARLTDTTILLDICHGLVVRNDLHITLAHDSVRSFLTGEHIKGSAAAFFALDADRAHAHIMSRCLLYLQLDDFAGGPVMSDYEYDARLDEHPLAPYATFSWPVHSEKCVLQPQDERLILDFFETKTRGPNGSSFDSWVQCLLEDTSLHAIRSSHPLYYAASFNMVAIIRILVRPELGIDIEQRGGRFASTPLFVALWRRNWEAAEILLKAGGDPLAWDSAGTGYELAKRRKATRIVALMDEILAKRKAERMAKRKEMADEAEETTSLPIRLLDTEQGEMIWQR